MKKAVLIAPQQFEIQEIADPEIPSDGLLLKMDACGICGSDLRRWKEGPPAGATGVTPGHEISGTVLAVGADHQQFSAGDHLALAPDVHCGNCYFCQRGKFNLCDNLQFVGITPGFPGGFSEKIALSRDILTHGIVHKIPNGMPAITAALSEPACSVLACHQMLGTTLGDVVVIMGAGPIGCLHIVIAQSRGAQVIISEPSAIRRKIATTFQPDLIIDPFNENLENMVQEFTAGIGADIVICANPVAATQTQAVEIVRKAGKVILFGGLPKANPMTTLDSNRIHYGEIQILGSFSYHPTVHALALDLLHRQIIPAEKFISRVFPLEQIDEAYQAAASGEALKVVITA